MPKKQFNGDELEPEAPEVKVDACIDELKKIMNKNLHADIKTEIYSVVLVLRSVLEELENE